MSYSVNTKTIILVIYLSISTGLMQAQDKRPMSLIDRLEIPELGDASISMDGEQVIYTLTRADWEANRQISHIWRINTDGSEQIQLTSSEKGELNPVWAPDGMSIAFISQREPEEFLQIFILPNQGGEAVQLSDHQTGVTGITWSPDGQFIYFLAPDPVPDEIKIRKEMQDDIFGFEKDFQQQHLWRINTGDREEMRITEGDYSVLSFSVSRDGNRIAYLRASSPVRDDKDVREVWVMDQDGKNNKQITKNRIPESNPILSPDNSHILFIADANDSFDRYYNGNLFVATIETGIIEMHLMDLPYEVESADWSSDGKSIFFVANMGVHSELFRYDLNTGREEQLTNGKHTIRSWSYCSSLSLHLLHIEDCQNGGDVYILRDGERAGLVRVTRVYDYLSENFLLPKLEKVQWKGTDEVTIEGLLYYPINYKKGEKYPLVVQTHGGPRSSDQYGLGRWRVYIPTLTARGYVVFAPNYRGSTGYGDDFLRDMVGNYFNHSHLDVMSGVDYLIDIGIADENRMVKMGWSAGGHMTNKIITHTSRFKAASSGAGAVNWISMYGQSDTRHQRTPWFNGTPWQENAPIDTYWDSSPLSDIAKVTTPTIIFVGENDIRVPAPQSIELYRALKSNGVPTELYIAPREPHGWRELHHRLFKMNAELEWFEKYALERDYIWEKAPKN
jgi:dipeptidyl aminopeptidase/acylaminoacyl peptidase